LATGASSDTALLEQQALGSNEPPLMSGKKRGGAGVSGSGLGASGASKGSFLLSVTQHLRLRRVAVEFSAALPSIIFGTLQLGDEGT
jgi:hypothetical protein